MIITVNFRWRVNEFSHWLSHLIWSQPQVCGNPFFIPISSWAWFEETAPKLYKNESTTSCRTQGKTLPSDRFPLVHTHREVHGNQSRGLSLPWESAISIVSVKQGSVADANVQAAGDVLYIIRWLPKFLIVLEEAGFWPGFQPHHPVTARSWPFTGRQGRRVSSHSCWVLGLHCDTWSPTGCPLICLSKLWRQGWGTGISGLAATKSQMPPQLSLPAGTHQLPKHVFWPRDVVFGFESCVGSCITSGTWGCGPAFQPPLRVGQAAVGQSGAETKHVQHLPQPPSLGSTRVTALEEEDHWWSVVLPEHSKDLPFSHLDVHLMSSYVALHSGPKISRISIYDKKGDDVTG